MISPDNQHHPVMGRLGQMAVRATTAEDDQTQSSGLSCWLSDSIFCLNKSFIKTIRRAEAGDGLSFCENIVTC